MFMRFLFRNERCIYANPYCIYNVYIKLKYVVPNVQNATLSPTCLQRRQFHVTSRNFINAPLDNNMKIDPNDPLVTKIRSEPQILASIQEFSRLLQGKGVDLSTGQMPSMLQMAKLASDKEVNAKIMAINSQLTKAGITLDAQTAQKFMSLANSEKASEPNVSQISQTTQKTPKQVIPKADIIEESKVTTATTAKAPVKQAEQKVTTATAKAPVKQAEHKVATTAATAKAPVKQAEQKVATTAAPKVTKVTKEQEQPKQQLPKESVGFIAKIRSWIFGKN